MVAGEHRAESRSWIGWESYGQTLVGKDICDANYDFLVSHVLPDWDWSSKMAEALYRIHMHPGLH